MAEHGSGSSKAVKSSKKQFRSYNTEEAITAETTPYQETDQSFHRCQNRSMQV